MRSGFSFWLEFLQIGHLQGHFGKGHMIQPFKHMPCTSFDIDDVRKRHCNASLICCRDCSLKTSGLSWFKSAHLCASMMHRPQGALAVILMVHNVHLPDDNLMAVFGPQNHQVYAPRQCGSDKSRGLRGIMGGAGLWIHLCSEVSLQLIIHRASAIQASIVMHLLGFGAAPSMGLFQLTLTVTCIKPRPAIMLWQTAFCFCHFVNSLTIGAWPFGLRCTPCLSIVS